MEISEAAVPNSADSPISRSRSRRTMKLWSAMTTKQFVCFLIPFVISPLAFSSYKESRCAFIILWMGTYWILEPVNITVTALLPAPLMPLLGILDAEEVAANYMKQPLMLFIGALGVAIAVEHCNLHERIALKVLLTLGAETKWLMLGFMLTTMFLSMWINNAATTAMMLPIIEAVIHELQWKNEGEDVEMEQKLRTLHKTLLLGVAYSANFVGTGTITEMSPDMMFKGDLSEYSSEKGEITYGSWIAYNILGMLLGVFSAWLLLQLLYVSPCVLPSRRQGYKETGASMEAVFGERYKQLGPITFHEVAILTLFILLVFLWIFRDPKFMNGWADLLAWSKDVGDAVPAIAILFLMFFIPANPCRPYESPTLLCWKTIEEKMPWGIILSLGGGYALADGVKKSGLSEWLGNEMTRLFFLSTPAVLVILCFVITFLREIIYHDSIIPAMMVPVVNQMVVTSKINSLLLMFPVTILASYAFMLPVATGPNAMIFSTGIFKTREMIKPGIMMDTVNCFIQLTMVNTYGAYLFDINTIPDWANNTTQNITAISNVTNSSYLR